MTNGGNSTSGTNVPPPKPLSAMELTEELLDVRSCYASQDKKLMSIQFDLEVFTRKQEARNKKIEDNLAILVDASRRRRTDPPNPANPTTKRWKLPPSVAHPPHGTDAEPLPKIKPEVPRFNGDNATEWIRKIQRYFNHHYTPLQDQVYLTSYLFDHPASSWLTYWEDNFYGSKAPFRPRPLRGLCGLLGHTTPVHHC